MILGMSVGFGHNDSWVESTDVQGRSQTWYTAHVMALSAMGVKLGYSGFLPTTHAKANAKQMRPRSLHAIGHFNAIYIHAQTTVDAGDIGI